MAEAKSAGFIVEYESSSAKAAKRWEVSSWSRMVYLLFSQTDISYLESTDEMLDSKVVFDYRRKIINEYLDKSRYPAIVSPDCGAIVFPSGIDGSAGTEIDIDLVHRRRSIRRYSKEKVQLDCLFRILRTATENIRIAEVSKQQGDPLFLLNSFFCWVKLYVVIQGVEGILPGTYWYDSIEEKLVRLQIEYDNLKLIDCIQSQNWVGEAGFCVFISAQWDRYQWLYRHSRAYVNLLVQLGEIGQEFLNAAYSEGLGGWLTSAVHETKSAHMLGLDENAEDVLYFIKFGVPYDELR